MVHEKARKEEDNVLFPMSQQILGPDGMEELSAQFKDAEARMPAGVHAKYLGVAQALANRYGVDTTATAQVKPLSLRRSLPAWRGRRLS